MPRRWARTLLAGVLTAELSACASAGLASGPKPFPHAPSATWTSARDAAIAADVLARAMEQRGIPYRLGGEEPSSGFDCSGLVRYLFGKDAIALPRTVSEQYQVGAVVDRQDVRPGDLIFFTTSAPGPSHVGIAIDQETFIHAPGTGSVVRVERFTTPYWRTRLTGIRRVTRLGQH